MKNILVENLVFFIFINNSHFGQYGPPCAFFLFCVAFRVFFHNFAA